MKPWTILKDPKAEDEGVVITIGDDAALGSKEHIMLIARFIVFLDIPRREIPDWMLNTFYGFAGQVKGPDGRAVDIDDDKVYDAFSTKGDFRWISDLVKWAWSEPRQKAQGRVLERLRYLTVVAAIHSYFYGEFDGEIYNIKSLHPFVDECPARLRRTGAHMRPYGVLEFAVANGERHISTRRYIFDHGVYSRELSRIDVARRYVLWAASYAMPKLAIILFRT